MKSDDQKFEQLKRENPELYRIARENGTEAPFSGKYLNENAKGMYKCAVCGQTLFKSDTKFESSAPGLAGWPSFDEAIPESVEYIEDNSYGMHRTEVVCSKCKSHLGHLFDDKESKTGKHFCMNGVCLDLEKDK
jgi:peptide-methionine (R)-S-oxide reductase